MLEPRLILIHLLIKLGVAATVSTVLGRSKEFRKLLFRENRRTTTKNLSGALDGAADRGGRVDPV